MHRDLAKIKFVVNKQAQETTTRINKIEEITIRRAADKVQPFALKGTSASTYVLPYGFGDPDYNQDQAKGGVLGAIDNLQQSANATDDTFSYPEKDITKTANEFKLRDFYMLPNAAEIAEKGTIIVIKVILEKSTDGGITWTAETNSKFSRPVFHQT